MKYNFFVAILKHAITVILHFAAGGLFYFELNAIFTRILNEYRIFFRTID
jgi:hypothetical protein